MTQLRQQHLEQRIATGEGAFRRLGHVDVARQTGSPQTIVITITHPGWGAPTTAHLSFVETWILEGGLWALTKYAYDLLLRPGPGRCGFHWHDGTYHTHCVDPADPGRDHHFAGGPVDLFAAFNRFTALLNGTEPLTCAGLRPLRG
ncbi:MAG: hypothetical protein V2B17_08315 [Chloroflexota bacterium]